MAFFDDVHTTRRFRLGTRIRTSDSEFIYLQGVASTVSGSVVTFKDDGTTALIAANAVSPVAVAKAAVGAGQFGWYQIYGQAKADCAGAVAAGAKVYISATAGKVGDAVVTGDQIAGMVFRETTTGAGLATVQLSHPVATDSLG